MKYRHINLPASAHSQEGISILVALVMLIVLTLLGVSSMNSAIIELKMAGSMQQQGIAMNRAEELLRVGEDAIDAIITNPTAFDFATGGDAYYTDVDAINVYQIDWPAQGLVTTPGTHTNDAYVTEYLGSKPIPGETIKLANDGTIIGGVVYTFRITTRSVAGKNALRLVQSIYVSANAP